MPTKFIYQHYAQVRDNLVVLEPWGWVSVINLKSLARVCQFRAYDRRTFTVWLGVCANADHIICSIWSAQTWQTKVFDYEGNLIQRLPSGEVHLFEDHLLVSANSNDQVVFYSLSKALTFPLFDEEFGNMEFDFDIELMPEESFGLFTWKPNIAIEKDFTAVEWNSGVIYGAG